MKENKLIEMSNKIDTMGSVLNRIVQELNTMKDISVGTTELLKLMPGYKKALKELNWKSKFSLNQAIMDIKKII